MSTIEASRIAPPFGIRRWRCTPRSPGAFVGFWLNYWDEKPGELFWKVKVEDDVMSSTSNCFLFGSWGEKGSCGSWSFAWLGLVWLVRSFGRESGGIATFQGFGITLPKKKSLFEEVFLLQLTPNNQAFWIKMLFWDMFGWKIKLANKQ